MPCAEVVRDMNRRQGDRQMILLNRRTIDACAKFKQSRSEADFRRLITTRGAKMAHAHHVWASPLSAKPIGEFWSGELDQVEWDSQTAASIERVVRYLKARRRQWLEATLKYLPEGHVFDTTIYLIGGYDSIVYLEDVALNLTFRKYLDDPREAVYYLIHELSHAGYFRYRPMPDLGRVKTTRDLLRTVKLLTHLEGMGVASPFPERLKEGGLEDDDYRVLLNESKRRARVRQYFELLSRLENGPNRLLCQEDPQLGDFSEKPGRLWYVAGGHMALRIEECCGIRMLQDTVKSGPKKFFETYVRLEDPLSL